MAVVVLAALTTALTIAVTREFAQGRAASGAPAPESGRPDDSSIFEPVGLEVGQRPVYPHSIVPGGIYTPGELQQAVARDPVVAAHYAHVSMADARLTRTSATRRVYMSYRIGDEVYWTKTPVTLPEGEAVLTDGISLIRARCGNCISAIPQGPTSEEEPEASEFDRVLAPPPARLRSLEETPEPALASVFPGPPLGPLTDLPLVTQPSPLSLVPSGALASQDLGSPGGGPGGVPAGGPGGSTSLVPAPNAGGSAPGGEARGETGPGSPSSPGVAIVVPPLGPLVDPPTGGGPPGGGGRTIPEPAVLLLAGTALGLYTLRRRRRT